MMENKLLEPKLEGLLITKNFNDLSKEERNYVLATFSEEEYNTYAFVLRQARVTLSDKLDDVQPSPYVKAAINDAFNEKYSSGSRNNFIFFKIAASILVLLGCVMVSYNILQKNERVLVSPPKKRLPIAKSQRNDQQINMQAEGLIQKEEPEKENATYLAKYSTKPNLADSINDADLCKDIYATDPEDISRSEAIIPCLDPMNASLIARDDRVQLNLR